MVLSVLKHEEWLRGCHRILLLKLTFSLSLLRWAIDDIDLPSKSNISKTVRLSIALQKRFLKNMLQAFQWYAWWYTLHLRFSGYWCLKFFGIIGISKIDFFNFSGNERVKQNKKNLKTIQNLLTLSWRKLSLYFSSNLSWDKLYESFILKRKKYIKKMKKWKMTS